MTDRQTLTRPNDPDTTATPDAGDKPDRKLDLSLTQVAGGALAAMTTAALGSRLGVGGTIAGAAFASVVAAVAGSLYTASLRTTREKVKTVWSGPSGRNDVAASAADVPATPTAAALPAAARMGRYSWRRILLGAVAVFGLAGFLLTGYEALAGQALSGGSGTTVEQVSSGRHSDSTDSEKKASDEDEEPADASPSPEESDDPEAEPTETTPSSDPIGGADADADADEPTSDPSTPPSTQSSAEAPAESGRAGSGSDEEASNAEPSAGSVSPWWRRA